MVDRLKHIRKGGEKAEEHREVEGDVKAEESDDGLGGEHVERTNKSDTEEELEFGLGVRERGWWWWEAKSLVTLEDDGLLVCLAGEQKCDPTKYCEEDDGPLGPAPILAYGDKGTDHRPSRVSREGLGW